MVSQGTMKKGDQYPSSIEKKDMMLAMMKRMHPVNLLRRGTVEVAKKGSLPPVIITVRSFGKKKVCAHALAVKKIVDHQQAHSFV